ncbi:MAG: hypothetical protein M1826_002532 [Phylliscum demangeonii]|nr:MAG: hypothetical protein M1826_002532 [Phylliscum demangeonii]
MRFSTIFLGAALSVAALALPFDGHHDDMSGFGGRGRIEQGERGEGAWAHEIHRDEMAHRVANHEDHRLAKIEHPNHVAMADDERRGPTGQPDGRANRHEREHEHEHGTEHRGRGEWEGRGAA